MDKAQGAKDNSTEGSTHNINYIGYIEGLLSFATPRFAIAIIESLTFE